MLIVSFTTGSPVSLNFVPASGALVPSLASLPLLQPTRSSAAASENAVVLTIHRFKHNHPFVILELAF